MFIICVCAIHFSSFPFFFLLLFDSFICFFIYKYSVRSKRNLTAQILICRRFELDAIWTFKNDEPAERTKKKRKKKESEKEENRSMDDGVYGAGHNVKQYNWTEYEKLNIRKWENFLEINEKNYWHLKWTNDYSICFSVRHSANGNGMG